MFEFIWIAIAVHVIVAVLVAGAIVAWRAYVEDGRKNTEREP
jgi:heme exporter protein D